MRTKYSIKTSIYHSKNQASDQRVNEWISFLHQHLESYGDSKLAIQKAIAYSLEKRPSFGGFVAEITQADQICALAVINKTGMEGYIPENILVYIATHKNMRGTGLGKRLMKEILDHTVGDIALHVDDENPAQKLYEHFGFSKKYIEMRLIR